MDRSLVIDVNLVAISGFVSDPVFHVQFEADARQSRFVSEPIHPRQSRFEPCVRQGSSKVQPP